MYFLMGSCPEAELELPAYSCLLSFVPLTLFLLNKMHETSSTKYTTLSGYFLQDEPNTDSNRFDYVANICIAS